MILKSLYSAYINNGLTIFPTQKDKSPLYGFMWKTRKASLKDFTNAHGVGMACGNRFNDIGVVDIDNKIGNTTRILEVIAERVGPLFGLLVVNKSVRDGYHLIYRCTSLKPSTKVCYMCNFVNGKYECVIETKEHDSYVVIPPTLGYETIQGDMLDIPYISPEERASLLSICYNLNEKPKQAVHATHRGTCSEEAGRYAMSLLEQEGWTFFGSKYVRRPGKSSGNSGTFGFVRPDTLYVFSTDSDIAPFQEKTPYGPLDIVAHLDFKGDVQEAKRFFSLKNWKF